MTQGQIGDDPSAEVALLRAQLAQDTLRAISAGEVDALLISDQVSNGQVFTLSSADRPYRMFVDAMAEGAATVSTSGVILYVNRRLADMLGTSAASMVTSELTSFVSAAHRDRLVEHLSRQDPPGPIEIEMLGGRDQPVWVRLSSSMLDVDGSQMLCLTLADLTQSRQDQAELASAHRHALRALQVRSQFLANMSHEIRTPLNGVTGLADLLLSTELTGEQHEYVDGLRSAADALLEVVDAILDFSKLDEGQVELTSIPFTPVKVLEEACSILAAVAFGKGVELMSEVTGTLPGLVLGDPSRLRQVLTNLLSNAIKFTSVGHVNASVSGSLIDDCWSLRFEVRDTGMGVPEAAQKKIFLSFTQADDSTTREYGGTGLGLAICRQLVELMGGQIGIEPAVGGGSVFWFTIAAQPAVVTQRSAAPSVLSGHVLLVDDNAASRHVLEGILTSWGLTWVSVGSGAEALVECDHTDPARKVFDLVLTDCDMPDMNGIDLTKQIRSGGQSANRAPSVVLMLTEQRHRARAKQAGADLLIAKPVQREPLHAALAQALKIAHTADPGKSTRQQTDSLSVPTVAAAGNPPSPPSPAGLSVATIADPQADASRWILLVEDNRINQTVATRMLQKRGFEVDLAVNGQLALDMHQQRPYVAVLMDCQMPVLDGYEATREIRRRETGGGHVPIVAMTANTIKGDREKCLAAGMDDYVAKPVNSDALDAAIERAATVGRLWPDRGHASSPVAGPVDHDPPMMFDQTTIDDLCHGDITLGRDLLVMFAHHLTVSLIRLERAAEQLDLASLAAEADQLRVSAASVGAQRIQAICEKLRETVESDGGESDGGESDGGEGQHSTEQSRGSAVLDAVTGLMVELREAAHLTREELPFDVAYGRSPVL